MVYCPVRNPRKFLILFLPPALMILGWAFSFYHIETRRELGARQADEDFRCDRIVSSIKDKFEEVSHELLFVAYQFHEHGMEAYLEEGLLEDAWLDLAGIMDVYEQMRWIDTKGMERARVQYGPDGAKFVSPDKLQDKSDRYYFRQSVNLPIGMIYVSPLDLNIENGSVEEPRNPTLRLATPLIDGNGERHGIVVLNYRGNELLDRFSFGNAHRPVWLVNEKGYWLKGPSPEHEWGFMYARNDLAMGHEYPDAWKRIQSVKSGRFKTDDGLWTFRSVYPLSVINAGLKAHISQVFNDETEYVWKVVSFMPEGGLHAGFGYLAFRLGLFSVLLLTISCVGSMLVCQAQTKEAIAREALEEKVAELDVKNRDLDEAKAQAEHVAQIKADFLANMSHEIRTPLNAVVGMTDILTHCKLEGEARECADIIHASGETLVQLVNDILDFSKIESGKLHIEEHDFDLIECVEGTLDLLCLNAAEKGIELTCEIQPGVPPVVCGDFVRLRQVLLNLLSNALKFTEAGEVDVVVESDAVEGGHELLFSVKDTGIGIDENQVERIFESFTQADSSTTRRFGGTGLGLTISRNLAKLMGGRMWVESTVGQGSVFRFTIRVGNAGKHQPVVRKPLPLPLDCTDVLVVDDNDTNRRIICAQLTRWGLAPRPFSSPREALKSIADGDAYALMVCDVQMPDMDGIMLVSEIRKHRSARELPILILTSRGADIPGDVDVFASLNKPVKVELLYNAIASVLRGEMLPSAAPGAQMCSLDAQGLKILVVEDNRLNQEVMKRLLEKLGVVPDFAGDGQVGVEMDEATEYDIVFMDVQMPVMDGYEATRRLVKRHGNDRTKPWIIGMSAHAMEEHREIALSVGMNDYIAKPVKFSALKVALMNASGRSG